MGNDPESPKSTIKPGNLPDDADLRADLRSVKEQVDALEVTVMGQKKPWYRDASTLIALFALLFSFGTTFVSYHRTAQQDVEEETQELRGFLEKLATLPRDNLAAQKQYQGDSVALAAASSSIAEENALLVREAVDLARKLPKGDVSATDYYAIGTALQKTSDVSGARKFFENAIESANDFNDEIAAVRSEANLDFIAGHPRDGRAEYQKALGIFSKYAGYNQYTQVSTNVYTETMWAFSEASLPNFAAAQQHLDEADKLIGTLPFYKSPGVESLKLQVAQLRAKIKQSAATVPMLQAQPVPAAAAPQY